jgi:hypothetical protein
MKDNKRYLGDAVYAELDHGMIKLTTSNGVVTDNTIFIEREVMIALMQFAFDAGWGQYISTARILSREEYSKGRDFD